MTAHQTWPRARHGEFVPQMGCIALVIVVAIMCLLPWLLFRTMESALSTLHFSTEMAGLVVLGIFLGSLINIPLKRYPRDTPQPVLRGATYGLEGFHRSVVMQRNETVLAVNVGGCIIPAVVAIWELQFILAGGAQPILALALAVAINIAVCYRFAQPIEGVGIAMPAFLPPAAAVIVAWLLLGGFDPSLAHVRAPVAYIAGVTGPLVGADLLNLNKITKISTGMASIGGAGTFDGIVFSGIVAALLGSLSFS